MLILPTPFVHFHFFLWMLALLNYFARPANNVDGVRLSSLRRTWKVCASLARCQWREFSNVNGNERERACTYSTFLVFKSLAAVCSAYTFSHCERMVLPFHPCVLSSQLIRWYCFCRLTVALLLLSDPKDFQHGLAWRSTQLRAGHVDDVNKWTRGNACTGYN